MDDRHLNLGPAGQQAGRLIPCLPRALPGGCVSLTELSLPAGVIYIGTYACVADHCHSNQATDLQDRPNPGFVRPPAASAAAPR